ncbi:MAG: hypothetical protein IJE94_02355 [Oscillospiraceae bacterium]|nr:hypothetical protein [Oscillospiraceae bacterium]
MNVKRIFSFCLAVMLLAGLSAGCGSAPKNATAATPLTAEEDARLKEELQADIDAILNTETKIVHSDTYIAGETYTGTAYYVSNDGNDNNDGLSPETAWKTLKKVAEVNGFWGDAPLLKAGDAVFFRRGDVFRMKEIGWDPYLADEAALHLKVDGVIYSAYGEGEKPIITESTENGSGAEKWNLVYEDDTGKKIWQYYRDMRDVSRLVLNDGEVLTPRVYEYYNENGYTSCEATGWWQHEAEGVTLLDTLLPLEDSMTENLTIISRPVRLEPESHWINGEVGPLYLRCDKGNPGELYQSIEFTEYQLNGIIQLRASDVVFDNISFRCNGSAYMKSGWESGDWKEIKNTVIQNCEFAYGGCTVTFYREREDGALVVEVQGDGIYNIVRNTTIRNNYFHDGATSSVTYEGDNFDDKDAANGYFRYLDNVSVNTNGIRLDSTADALKYLDSVKVCGNQVWNTGRMDSGKYGYSEGSLVLMPNNYGECIVSDNVFYGTENGHAMNALLDIFLYDFEDAGYTRPQFGNNTYVQYAGRNFGDFLMQGGETWAMDDPQLLGKAANLLGDTTSQFYIIPTE